MSGNVERHGQLDVFIHASVQYVSVGFRVTLIALTLALYINSRKKEREKERELFIIITTAYIHHPSQCIASCAVQSPVIYFATDADDDSRNHLHCTIP